MQLDQTFVVSETTEFREGAVLVARYLPDFVYRVTERNIEFVNGLEEKGIAQQVKALGAKTSGAVTTNPEPEQPAKASGRKKKGKQ